MPPVDWAHARDAYDDLASVYDRLTEDYDHALWLTYRTTFAGTHPIVCGEQPFAWRGLGSPRLHAGGTTAAVVSRGLARSSAQGRAESIEDVGLHIQRHYGVAEVVELLTGAGLVADVVLGQSTGCVLDRHADDLHRAKTVYVPRHPSTNGRGGEAA